MIKNLRITNFRSCRSVNLHDLGDIIALIGRNGAGKTNLLRAIDWLARVATESDSVGMRHPSRLNSQFPSANATTIEAEIDLDGVAYAYAFGISHRLLEKQKSTTRLEFEFDESLSRVAKKGESSAIFERRGRVVTSPLRKDSITVGPSSTMISLASVLPESDPLVAAIRPFLAFLHTVKYYPIDEPTVPPWEDRVTLIVPERAYLEWLAKYVETGDAGDSVVMRLIHMSLRMKPKFKELGHLLGREGLGIIDHLLATPIDSGAASQNMYGESESVFYVLRFRPSLDAGSNGKNGSNSHYAYQELSTGTRRMLRILVSLFFDAPKVMLLEHPEDGVHAALLRKLIAALKTNSGSTQIFLTSHSSTVLDELEPGDVRMVAMKEGKTVVRGLNKKEIADAARYLKEEGTLSEFFELAEEEVS